MNYHKKTIVYTTDENGKGKATYYEDNNGKVTKKTKKVNSKEEIDKLYSEFNFNDEFTETENFFDFAESDPFSMLEGFFDGFLGSKKLPNQDEKFKKHLPEDVDIDKHRTRLKGVQEKKKKENEQQQIKNRKIKALNSYLQELKLIEKQLEEFEDQEGLKDIQGDMKKVQKELEQLENK